MTQATSASIGRRAGSSTAPQAQDYEGRGHRAGRYDGQNPGDPE